MKWTINKWIILIALALLPIMTVKTVVRIIHVRLISRWNRKIVICLYLFSFIIYLWILFYYLSLFNFIIYDLSNLALSLFLVLHVGWANEKTKCAFPFPQLPFSPSVAHASRWSDKGSNMLIHTELAALSVFSPMEAHIWFCN